MISHKQIHSLSTSLFLFGVAILLPVQAQAATAIPAGCRAATAVEAQQLNTAANTTGIKIVCGNDNVLMNLGEFDEFYARLKRTSPCSRSACNNALACRTRNTGAQVCGAISRKWNSIGCARTNNTAIFPTVSHGFAAHINLLQRYCGTYGRCTIGTAIARWAPAGHGSNNPARYAATVSNMAGFPVNRVYNPNDVGLIGRIALSMSCVESGSVPYTLDELKRGIVMVGGGERVAVPANVGALLAQSNAAPTSQNRNNSPTSFLQNSPIGRFLGIPQQAPSSSSSSVTNVPRTPDGYLDPNRNPALNPENDPSQRPTDSSTSSTNNGENPSTTSGNPRILDEATVNGSNTATTTAPIQPKTLKNATPTLLCLPNPVAPGEKAIIMWACRDGAYKTTAENFDTNEDVIGAITVSPSNDTSYTVTCINDTGKDYTAATCAVHVSNPALAVIATPRQSRRGDTVSLSWKTNDTNSCVLTSSEHPSFERSGTDGDVISPTLARNTTFQLTCETSTGSVEKRSVGVEVN